MKRRHFEKGFRTTDGKWFTAYVDGSSYYGESVHGRHILHDGRVVETFPEDWRTDGRWFTIFSSEENMEK